MIHIDRDLLSTSLAYRVAFSRDFIGFQESDTAALRRSAPLICSVTQDFVDDLYSHLFEYSYTKAVFLKRCVGYNGDVATSLDSLTQDDPQIEFRKKFLSVWVARVFKSDYDLPETWEYLDKVGLMHTGANAFKHRANKDPLFVDLMPCTLLLGWVLDVIITIVMSLPEEMLPLVDKTALIRAFNKIIWLQQDLFQRHYIRTDAEAAVHLATTSKKLPSPHPQCKATL